MRWTAPPRNDCDIVYRYSRARVATAWQVETVVVTASPLPMPWARLVKRIEHAIHRLPTVEGVAPIFHLVPPGSQVDADESRAGLTELRGVRQWMEVSMSKSAFGTVTRQP